MEPAKSGIAADDLIHRWQVDGSLDRRLRALSVQPIGGCNACRFADPFSDRLCTVPDISAEDFDLGVSGTNCSRFEPYEAKAGKQDV